MAGLSSETKQLITEFYESDEVSHLLPGKEDNISVKLTDGSKTRVQKCSLLSNLSEICIHCFCWIFNFCNTDQNG